MYADGTVGMFGYKTLNTIVEYKQKHTRRQMCPAALGVCDVMQRCGAFPKVRLAEPAFYGFPNVGNRFASDV